MSATSTVNATANAPLPVSRFVYQRVRTLGGKALHLDAHLTIAARTVEHIYGTRPDTDSRAIAAAIAETLRSHHPNARTGATVMLYFYETGDGAHALTVGYERPLLEAGYAHSPLRPKAQTFDYSIPFGAFPTNFQIEAQALFDDLAFRRHGAARSVRRESEALLGCGDAPLFAVRNRTLITPPLTRGAMDSVERGLVIGAATAARLTVREEEIPHSELRSFEELFFADAAGITSLAECDGAKFMSLTARRLAEAMK